MTEYRYRRRSEVPGFLEEQLGVSIAKTTLDKWASTGEGPDFDYFGRTPVYREDKLLAWGKSRHLGARGCRPYPQSDRSLELGELPANNGLNGPDHSA